MGNELNTVGGAVATAATSVAAGVTLGQVEALNDAVVECAKFTTDAASKTVVRHVGETVGTAAVTGAFAVAAGATFGQVEELNDAVLDMARRTADSAAVSGKVMKESAQRVVEGVPVVGHIKGGIHYALGDLEGADRAMKSATRSTGFIAGGIVGAHAGPVGMIAGGFAGAAAADGITTGVETAVKGKYTPSGQIKAWTDTVTKNKDAKPDVVADAEDGLMISATREDGADASPGDEETATGSGEASVAEQASSESDEASESGFENSVSASNEPMVERDANGPVSNDAFSAANVPMVEQENDSNAPEVVDESLPENASTALNQSVSRQENGVIDECTTKDENPALHSSVAENATDSKSSELSGELLQKNVYPPSKESSSEPGQMDLSFSDGTNGSDPSVVSPTLNRSPSEQEIGVTDEWGAWTDSTQGWSIGEEDRPIASGGSSSTPDDIKADSKGSDIENEDVPNKENVAFNPPSSDEQEADRDSFESKEETDAAEKPGSNGINTDRSKDEAERLDASEGTPSVSSDMFQEENDVYGHENQQANGEHGEAAKEDTCSAETDVTADQIIEEDGKPTGLERSSGIPNDTVEEQTDIETVEEQKESICPEVGNESVPSPVTNPTLNGLMTEQVPPKASEVVGETVSTETDDTADQIDEEEAVGTPTGSERSLSAPSEAVEEQTNISCPEVENESVPSPDTNPTLNGPMTEQVPLKASEGNGEVVGDTGAAEKDGTADQTNEEEDTPSGSKKASSVLRKTVGEQTHSNCPEVGNESVPSPHTNPTLNETLAEQVPPEASVGSAVVVEETESLEANNADRSNEEEFKPVGLEDSSGGSSDMAEEQTGSVVPEVEMVAEVEVEIGAVPSDINLASNNSTVTQEHQTGIIATDMTEVNSSPTGRASDEEDRPIESEEASLQSSDMAEEQTGSSVPMVETVAVSSDTDLPYTESMVVQEHQEGDSEASEEINGADMTEANSSPTDRASDDEARPIGSEEASLESSDMAEEQTDSIVPEVEIEAVSSDTDLVFKEFMVVQEHQEGIDDAAEEITSDLVQEQTDSIVPEVEVETVPRPSDSDTNLTVEEPMVTQEHQEGNSDAAAEMYATETSEVNISTTDRASDEESRPTESEEALMDAGDGSLTSFSTSNTAPSNLFLND